MENEIIILSLSYLYLKRKRDEYEKETNKRSVWVNEWLLKRKEKGCTENLLKELDLQLPVLYNNFLRVSKGDFEYILDLIVPSIQKQNTVLRDPISPRDRLMVTLRFLATGDSFQSLSFLFRISQPAITNIVPETCEAIYNALKDAHLKVI